MYEYEDLARDESQQRLAERPSRWMSEWERKHPGACPMCGSHDGMEQVHRDDLAVMAESVVERHDWYRHANRDDVVFTPCPFCHTDTEGYEPMTTEEVEEWLSTSST